MQTNSFTQFLENMATAIQSKSSALVNLTVGSVMRAWMEATAGVALFLQSLIVYVASITRLSTSAGSDIDSFVGDFGVTREAAVAATGIETFSRATATAPAYVSVGDQVQTADGTQVFEVIADTTNAAFDSVTNQYTLAANILSLGILIQALTPGSGGNVQAGTINTLTTAIPGIDSVTNASAFTNGLDEQTDAEVKTAFADYIASRTEATKTAIAYAIDSLQQGLTYQIVGNQTLAGVTQYGYFYVVVDDGTGSPGSTLLNTVYNAIDEIRGITNTFGVFAPTVVTANWALTITVSTTASHATIAALVQTAVNDYINSLGLGETLYYTRLMQVAYDASTDVVDVSAVTLNGGTSDLTATPQDVIKAGTGTVS